MKSDDDVGATVFAAFDTLTLRALVTALFGFDVALTTLDFDFACLRTGAFFATRYGSCLLGARILLDDARDNNDFPGKNAAALAGTSFAALEAARTRG
jgi:hypothetical protein